ncbi:Uncharacterised protein [Klebsiella pneumoniae]|nr:Uncharacterised protein [Klebsiella pneumoniae]
MLTIHHYQRLIGSILFSGLLANKNDSTMLDTLKHPLNFLRFILQLR